MNRSLLFAPLVLAALLITACAADPDSGPVRDTDTAVQTPMPSEMDPGAPSGPDELADPCNADAAQALVGEQASADMIERARMDAGANTVRTLRPDQAVTMEYRVGRLNIDVDDNGVITGFRCG